MSTATVPSRDVTTSRRAAGQSDSFVGTLTLVRHVLRLDRVRLPVWIAGITGFVVVSAVSVEGIYRTPSQLDSYVRLVQGNPTLTAIGGPGYGFEDPNIGVVLVNETTLWAALACAVMSVFLLVRHTRAEEDHERLDLVRSTVVGRHAPAAAALAVVVAANLAVGALVTISVIALGFPMPGVLAYGASFTGAGLVFTAITFVVAQAVTSARGAIGWGCGAVGLAYALRAVGDLGDGTLSWVSPLGWAHQVRAFAGERWWVLLLMLLVTGAVLTGGFALLERRDLGGGLLPQRLGPAAAPRSLSGPLGLAVRLQRGQVVGWSLGLFLLGLVYGAVGSDVEQVFEDTPELRDFVQQVGDASLIDSFIAYTLQLGAMLTTGFAIAAVLRLRAEENQGRAEDILAAPIARARWASSHLVVAAVGSTILLVASGVGNGLGLALSLDDWSQLPRLTAASLAHLPAVLVVAGVAVLLFGALPRWTAASWGVLAVVVGVGLFAELLRLPEWMLQLSPFHHVPAVPAEPLSVLPLVVLGAIAVGLTAGGLAGLDRRDIRAV